MVQIRQNVKVNFFWRFWTSFQTFWKKVFKKFVYDLKSIFNLAWASLDVTSSKGVNINFLTILDQFWHFEKRFKKASLGLKKRLYLGLSSIRRKIFEKSNFE